MIVEKVVSKVDKVLKDLFVVHWGKWADEPMKCKAFFNLPEAETFKKSVMYSMGVWNSYILEKHTEDRMVEIDTRHLY